MSSTQASTCLTPQNYQNSSTSLCYECPAGSSCNNGFSNPTNCSTSQYSLQGVGTCSSCPSGSYCDSQMSPISCPAGTFQGVTTQGAIVCQTCYQGYQCTTTSLVLCSTGSISDLGVSNCTTCTTGYVCPSSLTASQTLCTDGYYPSNNKCTACPINQYCSSFTILGNCPTGWYSPVGISFCMQCPLGKSCSTNTTCASGYYPDINYICQQCPAGYSCSNYTYIPTKCANGYYSPVGQSNCLICPQGSYCSNTSSTSTPVACATGYVSNVGMMACEPCPIGYNCSNSSYSAMTLCPIGTYSNLGSGKCTNCTVGSYCPNYNQSISCPIGTFQQNTTATSCNLCGSGQQCSTSGLSSATNCTSQTSSIMGSNQCLACPSDSLCNPYLLNEQSYCPPGTYISNQKTSSNPSGSTICAQCGWNQECANSQAITCPLGYTTQIQNTPGQSYCNQSSFPYISVVTGTLTLQNNICYLQDANQGSTSAYIYRLPNYNYQYCIDCKNIALASSICTFSTNYFTSHAGINISTPLFRSTYYLWFDGTSDRYISQWWMNNTQYIYPYWVRLINYYTFTTPSSSAQTCYKVTQYSNANGFGGCKPSYPGFTSLDVNGYNIYSPTGIQMTSNRYSKLLQTEWGTELVLNWCPPTSQSILNGGGSESQACMLRERGQCMYNVTSHFCYGGYDYYCPIGFTVLSTRDKLSINSCSQCPLGEFCSYGYSRNSTCIPGYTCPVYTEDQDSYANQPGNYQPSTGSSNIYTQSQCQNGTYCPAASANSNNCPIGFYSDVLTNSHNLYNCHACAPGSSCNTQKFIGSPVTCQQGYICPEAASNTTRIPCPPSYYSNSVGLLSISQCQVCSSGSYCYGSNTGAVNCPAGFYCPNITLFPYENACPAGKTTVSSGNQATQQSDCQSCPIGSYCREGGFTSINNQNITQISCPINSYCPINSSYKTMCPNGTYRSSISGQSSSDCTTCQKGTVCTNGTSPVNCPSGMYMNVTGGSSSCITTLAGTIANAQVGSTTTTICPAGQYSQNGSSNCQSCTIGYYCSGDGTMLPCSLGMYCPSGSSAQLKCPSGIVCNNTMIGYQQPCPAGMYCPPLQIQPSTTPLSYYTVQGQYSYSSQCSPGYLCNIGSIGPYDTPCPAMSYMSSQLVSQTQCFACPAGQYCPSGSSYPINCPQGYYCLANITFPIKCPKGTYSNATNLQSLSQCTSCDAGKVCQQAGLTKPDGICDPGYYCLSGSYTTQPDSSNILQSSYGGLCPSGSYCPKGSASPQPCPNGTYNSFPGMRSSINCIQCTPGYYCNGQQNPLPTGMCSGGYYCPLGSSSPTQYSVQAGYYSAAGSANQTLCPPGTYSNVSNSITCNACPQGLSCQNYGTINGLTCPTGYYCNFGSIIPTPCPIGTYNPTNQGLNISSCKQCDAGYYCNSFAQSSVTGKCNPGFFCISGAQTPSPSINVTLNTTYINLYGICPRGSYCSNGIATQCQIGYYLNTEGSMNQLYCQLCPGGSYCNSTGLAIPSGICTLGYYCPAGSSSSQAFICPIGKYCPFGSTQPLNCTNGMYQPLQGQATCLPCSQGYYCPEGATQMLSCQQGDYCPNQTTFTNQYQCPSTTINQLLNQYNSSSCLSCPSNLFCRVQGSYSIDQIGIGYISNGVYNGLGGSSSPLPSSLIGGRYCNIGYYCLNGTEYSCPSGSYCNDYGLQQISGQCQAGFYCQNNSISYAPQNLVSQKGAICPIGFYCPSNSSVPIPCPIGTFGNGIGYQSINSCQACPKGYICNQLNQTVYTLIQCPAGLYCNTNASNNQTAQACPLGFYCSLGTKSPIPCPSGTFNNQLNQSSCQQCQIGYYCPYNSQNGTINQISCPKGYICPTTSMNVAYPCSIGTYQNNTGQTICLNCPAGYYCPLQGMTVSGIICPGGFYCPANSTSYVNNICLPGQLCPSGSSIPTSCPGGYYCSGYGNTQVTGLCSAGYYCSSNAYQKNPIAGLCPTGSYCLQGSSNYTNCPSGTYNDKIGSDNITFCQTCPSTSTCTSTGLKAPQINCAAGYYCPQNSTLAQLCQQGYMCPTNSTSQTLCQPGYYQDQSGQASCKQCQAGNYCYYNSTTQLITNQTLCPQGFYCPNGTQHYAMYPCPIGTYNNCTGLNNSSQCTSCDIGSYCSQAGQLQPTGYCADGYVCNGGATLPTGTSQCPQHFYCSNGVVNECPQGTYTQTTGCILISECIPCPAGNICQNHTVTQLCPAGYYCESGLYNISLATSCPIGMYCQAGSANPSSCPPGTYNNQLNQSSCSSCPAGFYCDEPATTSPFPCDINMSCPLGASNPLPCPIGYYADFNGQCQYCPAGYYCWPTAGSNGIIDLCEPGYVCQQGSSSPMPYTDTSSISSSSSQFKTYNGPSMPGYYSDGTKNYQCSPGTFAPSGYFTECISCLAGHYCPYYGYEQCKQYEFGSTVANPNDGVQGVQCPIRSFCVAGAIQPMLCPDGYQTTLVGQSICGYCPYGQICDNTDNPTSSIVMCPSGMSCTGGISMRPNCNSGFYNDGNSCTSCTLGQYCTGGVDSGSCAAGYFCSGGAASPTPQGSLCPTGQFCNIGARSPAICPIGKYLATQGGQQQSDCTGCLPGYLCQYQNTVPQTCPIGYYCPIDQNKAVPCPIGTYSNVGQIIVASECQSCPAGYLCTSLGTTDYTLYPCPSGQFCPYGTLQALNCTSGTFRATTGGQSQFDCGSCPLGFYCPIGSINPIACPNGTYCSGSSPIYLTCNGGYYCNNGTIPPNQQRSCPANYYCPRGTSQPIACSGRLICPYQSEIGVLCPAGFYVQNSSSLDNQVSNMCLQCPPGTFSTIDNTQCLPCTAGYLCFGGTNKAEPISYTDDNGVICPEGNYCPTGSSSPIACPTGTYNPQVGASDLSQCSLCPADTFNAITGQSGCRSCGAYANSNEGSLTCQCQGSYRSFSSVDSSCRCMGGYTFIDSTGADRGTQSSVQDCTPIIYDRCSDSQIRTTDGTCADSSICSTQCSSGAGTLSVSLGICTCNDTLHVDSLCNQTCRSSAVTMKISSTSIVTSDGNSIDTTATNFVNGLSCTGSSCSVKACSLLEDGSIHASYSPALLTSNTHRRILQSNSDTTTSSINLSNSIPNPIYCINIDDSMLFTITNNSHYPIYSKDSVINSNPSFDYGSFLILQDQIIAKQQTNDSSPTLFGFTFQSAGSYVFTDSSNSSSLMIVTVMEVGQTCPDIDRYIQSITSQTVASVGVQQKSNLILKPDIPLILGMSALLLLSTAIVMIGIGYCLHKGWTLNKDMLKNFRQKQELVDIDHTNESTFNKDNDFDKFISKEEDHDEENEDDFDQINLDIQNDLVEAGQDYLQFFEQKRDVRREKTKAKRKEIATILKELESLICTIGHDAMKGNMQIYNENEENYNELNAEEVEERKRKEKEAQQLKEQMELEAEKKKREEMLNSWSQRDQDHLKNIQENLNKKLDGIKKELGEDFNRINKKLNQSESNLEEEISYALYDEGNIRSRQNQIVKRIEQNQNLSDAEKEQLLLNHEKNLSDIDKMLEQEKKQQDIELERALKEKIEKRKKQLEKKNKGLIQNDIIEQEILINREYDDQKKDGYSKLDEEFNNNVEKARNDPDIIRHNRSWMEDLRKQREQQKKQLDQTLDQEKQDKIKEMKSDVIKKYTQGYDDDEMFERDIQTELGLTNEQMLNIKNWKKLEEDKITKLIKEENVSFKEKLEQEREDFEKKLNEKDVLEEERKLKKKNDILKSNNLLQDDENDKEAQFKKILSNVDREFEKQLLIDQLRSQDEKLAFLLNDNKSAQEKSLQAKLEARKDLLRNRQRAAKDQEQENQRMEQKMKLLCKEEEEKSKLDQQYISELYNQKTNDTDIDPLQRVLLIGEQLSDSFLNRLQGILMRQFAEKESSIKLLLQKYMDQKIIEKANIQAIFKIDYDQLNSIKNQIGNDNYQEALKQLKLKEENMLRDIDLQLEKSYKEEEAKLREDLDQKHMEEQIQLKKQEIEIKMKLKHELLKEDYVDIKEDEQDRKNIKNYEEYKRKENDRKQRNLGLKKQEILRAIDQELNTKYQDYEELLKRKKQDEKLIQEQMMSVRKKLQERKKMIREKAASFDPEQRERLLKEHKEQWQALDTVYEKERRRQLMMMQEIIMKKKQKQAKKDKMKKLVDEKDLDDFKHKMGNEINQMFEKNQEIEQQQDLISFDKDEFSLLKQKLEQWRENRKVQHEQELQYKLGESMVEIDPSTLKKLITKITYLEKSLKDLAKIQSHQNKQPTLRNQVAQLNKQTENTNSNGSLKPPIQQKKSLFSDLQKEFDAQEDESKKILIKQQDHTKVIELKNTQVKPKWSKK